MTGKRNDIEIKVRGYHLDVFLHVNNARYLEFLEEARWAYFEPILQDTFLETHHLAFVVVNINISYKHPACLNDTLIIHTTIKETGNRKVILNQTIKDKKSGKLVAEADVTFVFIDTTTGKSVELNASLLSALQL